MIESDDDDEEDEELDDEEVEYEDESGEDADDEEDEEILAKSIPKNVAVEIDEDEEDEEDEEESDEDVPALKAPVAKVSLFLSSSLFDLLFIVNLCFRLQRTNSVLME